ncbi:hypothetical protein [uncultured Marinococcus sp.]|uniref:hypothetical protein n=1 Tax=uncultured Marinococcus sp. TaxID=487012 RepID=UPI00262AC6AC|nr:hypothetical protein [uncultured Marinococcus sp.]
MYRDGVYLINKKPASVPVVNGTGAGRGLWLTWQAVASTARGAFLWQRQTLRGPAW